MKSLRLKNTGITMMMESGRIWRFLRDIAYPSYDCQNCIGIPEYQCYCMAMDAGGPGHGPNKLQVFLRKFVKPYAGAKSYGSTDRID